MKLLTILLLIVLLSSNYVISQTNCPKNGIKTVDGNCFYLSKEDCPLPWKDIGIIENNADYAIISDLLRKTQTRERVCMSIYDSDMKQIVNRQPKYMKKLREENHILLDKPIQDDESMHIAFRIKNGGKKAIIVIHDSSGDDIYFGKIEISNGQLRLSTNTEIVSSPENIEFKISSNKVYQLDIRFIGSEIQVFDSLKHKKLIKVDLSLNSKYSANMVSIENIEVYQLEHHDINCQSEVTYFVNNPVILRNMSAQSEGTFERTIITNFDLNPDNGKHNLRLPKKSKWANDIVFHLIGHNNSYQFDFQIKFVNSNGDKIFEFECSQGFLTSGYPVWVAMSIPSSSYFHWMTFFEDFVQSSESFTLSMTESNHKMLVFLGSEGESNEHSINHPCLKDNIMQEDCDIGKTITLIKSTSSYITGFRFLKKEILAKYCFSDYWISEITTKVPYQSDCGTEKHLNICRIRRNAYSESYQPLSTESSISDEQDEKLTKPMTFFGKEDLVKQHTISIVTPCFLLAFCLILNLINIVFECVLG